MDPSSEEPEGRTNVREPIRRPWIWVVLVLLVLSGVPWYWPPGTVQPVVLGVPLWALLVMGSSVLLSAYLSWLCLTQWNVVEDREERERRGGAPGGTGEEEGR